MARLLIYLLGPFEAALDGQPLTAFESDKVRALLAYLSVEAQRPHRREKLAGLLWPDRPEGAARNNLSRALTNLRQLFLDEGADQPHLLVTRQSIQFNRESDAWVDVHDFSQLLAGGEIRGRTMLELEEAVALVRGDFMEGFSLPDSLAFEEWMLLQREHLAWLRLSALHRLTAYHQGQGAYDTALRYAWQQVEIEPYQEEARQQLVHLLALTGQRSTALAQYDALRVVLRDEVGVEPSPETRRLYRDILTGKIAPSDEALRDRIIRGYDLLEPIGEGSFGTIYRALQPVLGREVAVKVIRPEYANRPEFVRRFEAEAQVVARLEHLHIVPLYDYWREPEGAYLVMRLFPQGSLQEALAAGPWEMGDSVRALDQVASALATAHARGVVHGDVKPANILLDAEHNAYLSDFGIAREAGLPVQPGADRLSVSPEYAAPEQWLGHPVTPLADLYSVGVVLYELLAGQHPFPGATAPELHDRHLHTPLPPVSRARPDLPAAVDEVVARATAKAPRDRFADAFSLAEALHEALEPEHVQLATGLEIARPEPQNPYLGLQPFQEADAPHFFGRDALLGRLLARLGEDGPLARLLALVGPSGSGKSSAVRAGLIPALRRGELPGSESWFVVDMLPGTAPLEELETALLGVAIRQPAGLGKALARDERGLVRATEQILPEDGGELLLFIDQFEELYAPEVDPLERERFLQLLHGAVSEPGSPLRIVSTLRADYYDRPLVHPQFGALLRERTEVVLPLTAEELGEAARRPAERVGVELEEGLEAAIVADVAEQPGALPMFQYALTQLFERRAGRILTREGYQATGGVSGALARRAEQVWAGLEEDARALARQVFLRLVSLGEGDEPVRRRVPLEDLQTLRVSDGQASAETLRVLTRVLDAFGQARLLLFDRDPATRAPTAEVAHEALLRAWNRLRGWLEGSRADLRTERLLAGATREWVEADRSAGFLLRGTRLAQFEGWAAETGLALTREERAFLEASVAARQARDREREARRQRELKAAQDLAEEQGKRADAERRRAEDQARSASRLRRRALYLAGALLVAVLLAVAAGVFGQQARRNANLADARQALAESRQAEAEGEATLRATAQAEAVLEREAAEEAAQVATSRELAAAAMNALDIDPELATLLALEALSSAETVEAENALHQAVPSLRLLGTASGHTVGPSDVAISPDGSFFVTASYDQTARLWDAVTAQEIQILPHSEWLQTVDISPDGQRLATGGTDRTLTVWARSSHEPPAFEEAYAVPEAGHRIWSVVFDPGGSLLVTCGDDGTARLWDVVDARELITLTGHAEAYSAIRPGMGGVFEAAFSHAGQLLATAGADGVVLIWDVPSVLAAASGAPVEAPPQPLLTLDAHAGAIFGLGFSPDDLRLATASEDGTTKVWDLSPGAGQGQALVVISADNFVTFSPDGTRLLTLGIEGIARIWDATTGRELFGLYGHSGGGKKAAFGPDGTWLVTTSEDGTAKIWDLSPARELLTLVPGGASAFSPDGKRLATGDITGGLAGGATGDVIIWDSGSGQPLLTLSGHVGRTTAVGFSPDGARLVTADRDGVAKVWDTTSGRELLNISGCEVVAGYYEFGAWGSSLSPGGTRLATACVDGTVRVRDTGTGEESLSFQAHDIDAHAARFSPDGKLLATSGWNDLAVKLWDAETGQLLYTITGTHEFLGIGFSPDGARLAAGDRDSVVTVWDISSGHPRQVLALRGHTGVIPALAFSPDGTHLATASTDMTARVWDLADGRELLTLALHTDIVVSIAFSPDGRRLATASPDGTTRVYALDLEELVALARDRVTRSLTDAECRKYLHLDACPP